MNESYIQSSLNKEDKGFELSLRPSSLDEFIGQEDAVARLKILVEAAKKRGSSLGHVLLLGPPGLGKTTLAQIISKAIGSGFTSSTGPVLEKAGDLAGILTNLQKHDVLFIDEIHRLSSNIEEYLYSAMEDFALDLIIDTGPNARSVPIHLQSFCLVGATTRAGLLSSPLRTRFASLIRLDYYDQESLSRIVKRSALLLQLSIDDQSAHAIAKRARGTPRIANNLLKWVRDYAQIHSENQISPEIVQKALEMLSIDDNGLDEMDKKILTVIIEHHNGGPVGLSTIAVAIGEDPETIADMHEPYLILQGYLKRTPRGRQATTRAYNYLGKKDPTNYSGDPS
jgi:holliday junction DNA helicase RuvB